MSKYQIAVKSRRGFARIPADLARRVVRKTLAFHQFPPCQVSVLFCGDQEIKELNLQYRKKNTPTDILSFPQLEGLSFPAVGEEPLLLGDIVISTQTAQSNAGQFKTTLEAELLALLIHGTLHLLGYQDRTAGKRAIMEKITREILTEGIKVAL